MKMLIRIQTQELSKINFEEVIVDHTYELAEDCIQTNYCGAKKMCEAFIPLLELSSSPRTVNVSSVMGKLEVNTFSYTYIYIYIFNVFLIIINKLTIRRRNCFQPQKSKYSCAPSCREA